MIVRSPAVKRSVSLRRDQLEAAQRVVVEEHLPSLSAYLQMLLTEDLRRRYGRDWHRLVRDGDGADRQEAA